jgi:hypothetical protein
VNNLSKETKSPSKRDQALNDATAGQLGTEPRPEVEPNVDNKDQARNKRVKGEKRLAA